MINFDGKKKRIIYTYGVYDLMHPGHIRFFQKCKRVGDILIVGIVSDKEVQTVKDPKKPIMQESWRFELVKNVKCVDYVINQKTYDPSENLLAMNKLGLKVDILAKGDDMYQIKGVDTIESLGGKFLPIPYEKSENFSTSELIRKILDLHTEVIRIPDRDGKGPRTQSPRPSIRMGGRKKGNCK